MLKRLFFAAVVASTVLLPSCRPGGAEYIDDLDVVLTSYSKSATFNKKTYARPDSIVEIEDADFKPGDTKKYINQSAANIILTRLDANMKAYGYTKVEVSADPELYVQLAAMKTTNVYYYYSYYYWGYPWYGGGWYYPGYYPPTYTTTTTGSLVMQMADRKDTTIDGKAPIIWNALVNGMMSGSSTSFSSRANKTVDQAFKQSPYLKLN